MITRLNHAVLFVRDTDVAVAFYRDVLGFRVVASEQGGAAVFMRAEGSDNHHDLGLFAVGSTAAHPSPGSTGLYHLAWEVGAIEDVASLAAKLAEKQALVGASDHGVSKSLYGRDPDGNEFEIMWRVPRDDWGEAAEHGVVRPLDLESEVARYRGH